LILGGVGFIGRHLVKYLYDNKLASFVCVADKVPYQIATLSEEEMAVFKNESFCAFKQADLRQQNHCNNAFNHAGGAWDYVINLAAVTKYSQAKEVYDANIVEVAAVTSAAAKAAGVKRYIHVSTSQVYKSKKPVDEKAKTDPWTAIGAAHLEAEGKVKASGVNHIIVRPALVYGTADTLSLTPRLIIGAIHKEQKSKMECLYSKDLRVNTVHVQDVARALHFLCTNGDNGAIFNLADGNDTNVGKVNDILENIYGIKTSFLNGVTMALAEKMGTKFLVGYANDEHLKPFSDACKKYNIHDTPLTPYLDEELIKENATAVDGTAITKIGFKYQHPAVTAESLREVMNDFVKKGFFPKELM